MVSPGQYLATLFESMMISFQMGTETQKVMDSQKRVSEVAKDS